MERGKGKERKEKSAQMEDQSSLSPSLSGKREGMLLRTRRLAEAVTVPREEGGGGGGEGGGDNLFFTASLNGSRT